MGGFLIQNTTPGTKSRITFRVVSLLALIVAFAQVTLGGVVRVTGSGLGCPDWPLCHGQIIPPFDLATMIEYSHRLAGSLLGILTLLTLLLAWWAYRTRPWVFIPCLTAMIVVIVAGIFGGVTVLTELAWGMRLIHLTLAEILITTLVIGNVAAWRHIETLPQHGVNTSFPKTEIQWPPVVMMFGILILILSGSFMVGKGYGSACATWPLCEGDFFPGGVAFATHMGHRYLTVIIGLLIVGTVIWTLKRKEESPSVDAANAALVVSLVVQVLFGAAVVWSGFASEFKGLHLSLATLTWMAGSYLLAVMWVPVKFQSTKSRPPKALINEVPESTG